MIMKFRGGIKKSEMNYKEVHKEVYSLKMIHYIRASHKKNQQNQPTPSTQT